MPKEEPTIRLSPANAIIAVVAALAIGIALFQLHGQYEGVRISNRDFGGAPTTIYLPASDAPAPLVVIAHGFAGSGRLMQSFALTLARNGYIAATFDFPGHGRNARPLTGDLQDVKGATRVLVDSVAQVAAAVRGQGDGRLAVLGHSMASDVIVRFAEEHPDVSATIAVSMFSPAVTATGPRDLLVIDGDWEGFLKDEGRRAVGLATSPNPAEPGVTYGDPANGTGRRLAYSRHVEHASVLYSEDSEREIVQWLDAVFGVKRTAPLQLDARGPWILVLLAGLVALARPLARALPAVAAEPQGAGLGWARLWAPAIVPMIVTPVLLRFLPTHFLPVLVGDYLSVHFAAYGIITAGTLWGIEQRRPAVPSTRLRGEAKGEGRFSLADGSRSFTTPHPDRLPASGESETEPTDGSANRRSASKPVILSEHPLLLLLAALAIAAYGFLALVAPINAYVTSFIPGPGRWVIVLALLCGALPYFLADEWLTRGLGAGRLAYPATKLAFLVSLGFAVALDFERLFFLILIVPIVGLFFIIHGLFSGWAYAKVRHPFAAGAANAIAFAWAIAVTFPLVAG